MKMSGAFFVAGALFAVAVLSAPIRAEAGGGKRNNQPNPSAVFQKLDVNNDGRLNRDEFSKVEHGKATDPKQIEKTFGRLDRDNDGLLTLDEFKKLYERRGKKSAV